jgi:hypothetical protein
MPNNTLGLMGTDGIVPVYNPEGRWCYWSISEIWTGQQGANRYVPKVNDYVIDPATFTTWIVDHLDPITLIPTLRIIRPANMSFSFSETDVLFGVGPGTQSDTYRVYIDQSVTPHVLAVDNRLRIAGSMASYVKIFKGSDLSETGQVISKVYDSSGNYISQAVPLELVAIDNHVNYAIKTVKVCHTTEELMDGEIVTAVVYSDTGHVVSKRQLLVENTSFIRSLNVSQKYVSHISLECPFLSQSVDNTIEFPLNVPLNALNMMGVVHYSDGSTLKLPVNGSKFTMHGVDQYVSSIVGQRVDLVLSYALSDNEVAYANTNVNGRYVTEAYFLLTTNPNNSYSVKLFGYPYFIDENNGYQMRWWLFNLDRNISFEVTPFVRFSENTGPYDPKGYGYLQRKSVSLNLRDVSAAFKPFIHTQLVDIVLNGPPTSDNNPWSISHESISTRSPFGIGLFAKRVGNNQINISSNFTDFLEWKDHFYKRTYPLVNNRTELVPPNPTHFVINYEGIDTEYQMDDWSANLNVSSAVSIYKTVSIKFIKRTSTGDIQLAIAATVIKP